MLNPNPAKLDRYNKTLDKGFARYLIKALSIDSTLSDPSRFSLDPLKLALRS